MHLNRSESKGEAKTESRQRGQLLQKGSVPVSLILWSADSLSFDDALTLTFSDDSGDDHSDLHEDKFERTVGFCRRPIGAEEGGG